LLDRRKESGRRTEKGTGSEKKELQGIRQKPGRGARRYKVRRVVAGLCWVLFVFGFIWSLYRNFTVVDRVTVKEETRIEEKAYSMVGVESFIKNFAVIYFAYPVDAAGQIERGEMLGEYMKEDLIQQMPVNLSEEAVAVSAVQVWEVVPADGFGKDAGIDPTGKAGQTYRVIFTVIQEKGGQLVSGAYSVNVYVEGTSYAILTLPHAVGAPDKADYRENLPKQDSQIDADTRNQVQKFLETFFEVYPTANEEELQYYIKGQDVKPLSRDLACEGVDHVQITEQERGQVLVECLVTYRDSATGLVTAHQFSLIMEPRDGKYVIVKM